MSGLSFQRERYRRFTFVDWRFDAARAQLDLTYRLEGESAETASNVDFTESIQFHGAEGVAPPAWVGPAMELAHLLAGASYYKTACPPTIAFNSPPSRPVAALVNNVYRHGLAEFAHRNNLPELHRQIQIQGADDVTAPVAAENTIPQGIVIPIGGGKDSLVTVDLLRRGGRSFRTISIGQSALIDEVVDVLGTEHIRISRQLDPRLFELNRQGALNGHVPISAILAAIMVVAAGLYGFDTIIMSNERSAESPNLVQSDGFAVNHQFSKSFAFERDFSELIQNHVHSSLRYFSLLRPWSELAIARHFAKLDAQHAVFSSCNRNFRLTGPAPERWCRKCPKCRFVWLMLAPFIDRPTLGKIFGGDLFVPDAESGFAELLGAQGHKPFECVGEIEESRAALTLLLASDSWSSDPLVRKLGSMVEPVEADAWLRPAAQHQIPGALAPLAHALG